MSENERTGDTTIAAKIKTDNKMCTNSQCLRIDAGILPAPLYCQIYFGQRSQNNNDTKSLSYLCKNCLALGQIYRDKCIAALYKSEPIIDIPTLSTIETGPDFIDLDTEPCSLGSTSEKLLVSLSDKEIASLTNELIVKTNLQAQAHACKKSLSDTLSNLVVGYDDLDQKIASLEKDVDAARALYSSSRNTISNNSRNMKFKSVFIDTDGNETWETDEDSAGSSKIRGVQKAIPRNTNEFRNQSAEDGAKMTSSDGADIQLVSRVVIPFPNKQTFLFETPKTIPRIMPRVGDKVYAMRKTSLCGWSLGEVDEIIKHHNAKPTFRIKFESSRSKATDEQIIYTNKELNAKQLAYNIPCPFILPVGTRIIGLFKDDCAQDEGVPPQESLYYAGVVAEPPKNPNNFRYLVFFDDGYAQYVQPTEVLLVCETSDPVWIDVHPDSQDFIKNYIQKYPERPMVRLNKGTVLSTEWSGQWWLSRVVEVDCSLAKMHFQSDNRYEWIYRGSTRLSPLYDSEKRQAERSSNRAAEVGTRGLPRNNRGQNKLTIEYLYGNEDVFQKKDKPVARKSTATIPGKKDNNTTAASTTVAKQKHSHRGPTMSFAEFEGKIQKVCFPPTVPQPKEYTPHECGGSCVIPYDPKALQRPQKDKPLNPLSFVMQFGWSREMSKFPRRQVFYRAPCGRRLRDMPELHRYLMSTNFNLSVDYFCFDQNVDCQNEFSPSKVLWNIKDIAYGKEDVPVQCINSLDHDYPEYVEYTRNRIKGKGVPLVLDENFLVCCDCTDDCQDKEKCACWNLTYECYKKTRNVTDKDLVGYSYRNLKEHQVSGIYECNPKCKCRKTCLNRVAQNPMKWLLQVFKTSNRGWAIRPLHDIPEGAFICVYSGQLLTEHIANEDGKNFGDEYLAELDFIEICEKYKEGYEEECKDPEVIEIDDVEPARKQRKTSSERTNGAGGTDQPIDDDSCDGFAKSRRQPSRFTAESMSDSLSKRNNQDSDMATRDYFSKGEQCYIMDAKSIGNIGRYLNHCCSPNVYVQNVFVDTHDLRFPWVAFFAYKTIRSGTEMTWDYNYEIGSVPGRILYCQCGSPECRGRLL